MTPAALHEQHKARVLGLACSTCTDLGVTGDTCAAMGHDPDTTRQHHSEATDALVVEALQDMLANLDYCYCMPPELRFDGSVCDSCNARRKGEAALKALGK